MEPTPVFNTISNLPQYTELKEELARIEETMPAEILSESNEDIAMEEQKPAHENTPIEFSFMVTPEHDINENNQEISENFSLDGIQQEGRKAEDSDLYSGTDGNLSNTEENNSEPNPDEIVTTYPDAPSLEEIFIEEDDEEEYELIGSDEVQPHIEETFTDNKTTEENPDMPDDTGAMPELLEDAFYGSELGPSEYPERRNDTQELPQEMVLTPTQEPYIEEPKQQGAGTQWIKRLFS